MMVVTVADYYLITVDQKLNLVATSAPAITDLSENMSRELLAYEVYRGLASGGAYTNVGTTDASVTSFVDEGLTNGTEYFYVVTAVYDEGESGYSNEASATPAEFEPIPPVNLQTVWRCRSSIDMDCSKWWW